MGWRIRAYAAIAVSCRAACCTLLSAYWTLFRETVTNASGPAK
jgi:hypothetical protein